MYHQTPNKATDVEMQTVSLGPLNVSISYADLLNEQTLEFFHAHRESIELYYVLEHDLELHLLDEHMPPSVLNRHDLILFNPGVGHNVIYSPNRPKKYFAVNFSLSQTERPEKSRLVRSEDELSFYAYTMQALKEHPFVLFHDEDGDIAKVIERILSCSESRPYYWKLLRRTLYAQLIILLFSHCRNLPEKEMSLEQNIAIRITQYLHANYQNPDLSLKALSKEFNLSTRQLTRVFEDYFSRTPSKTLTFYRISYAKNYLINTNWSIESIAEAVGFSSSSSLSRCFKEFENTTVSEFRKKNRHSL